MGIIKKIVKTLFDKRYKIQSSKIQDLTYECDGRIIRYLSNNPKKMYCAAYILDNIQK